MLTVCALVACSSGGSSARRGNEPDGVRAADVPADARPIDPALAGAAVRGADALAPMLVEMDPASLAIPAYLARRYGLTRLAASGARARALIARKDHGGGSTDLDRLVDPRASRPSTYDLRGVPAYERAIVAALWCRPGDANALAARVRTVSELGGYALTHATLAFGLASQRGCFPSAQGAAVRGDLATRLRAEIAAGTIVDDLAIERLAMLALIGETGPEAPVRAVAAAQRTDGSWRDPSERVPSWHPTMLGVWVMAAAASRGERVPFVAG